MKTLSRIVSLVFHPLLFPTYGALIILLFNPNMFGYFGEKLHIVWLIVVFALTFMFPAVWMLMMKRLEMVDSMNLDSPKERIIPMVATATFYLWCTWMFKPSVHTKIPPNQLIFYMLLGACLGIFIAFFINIFSKVSLHALGAGSLLGLLVALLRYSTYDLRLVLIAAILIAGVIGTARLILKAHTEPEIFMGYFIGFSGQFLAFTFFTKFF